MNELTTAPKAREWSPYQRAVFEWFEEAGGFGQARSLIVRARAGSGKTTTICEGVNRARERSIWVAAFNADIAQDLATKIKNPRAIAKTIHAIGFACIKKRWEGTVTDLDKEKGFRLAEEVLKDREIYRMIPLPERLRGRVLERFDEKGLLIVPLADRKVNQMVAQLATRVKEVDPFVVELLPKDVPAIENTPSALPTSIESAFDRVEEVAAEYDLGPEEAYELMGWTSRRVAAYALAAVAKAQRFEDYRFDFADMVFLPLVNGWTYPRFHMTVVDEAQDVSEPMLEFVRRMTVHAGRIVLVGDDRQAIYGFRGADSNALDRLKAELEADELPLSITYRCPLSVVREANRLVSDFYAAPGAPEGATRRVEYWQLYEQIQPGGGRGLTPGDVVVSRLNAPLLAVACELLRRRIPVQVLGREFAEALTKLVKKVSGNANMHLEEFLEELADYSAEQYAKLTGADRGAKTRLERVIDQCAALDAVARGMAELPGAKDTTALGDHIQRLFAEARKENVVTCSTVHKVKGLEWDRVFVLYDTMYVYGMRRHEPEEANIEYVALTRAKKELVLVVDMPGRRE